MLQLRLSMHCPHLPHARPAMRPRRRPTTGAATRATRWGHFKDAVRDFRAAIRLAPSDPDLRRKVRGPPAVLWQLVGLCGCLLAGGRGPALRAACRLALLRLPLHPLAIPSPP